MKPLNKTGNHLVKSRVTVAIPTYNRVALLARAVESVLVQSYDNVEVIISDNCSQDGTFAYLQKLTDPRIRIYRQPNNCGMVNNWDFCLLQATGEYFIILSDDDFFRDVDALIKFVRCLQDNSRHIRIAVSDVYVANSRATVIIEKSSSRHVTVHQNNKATDFRLLNASLVEPYEALIDNLEGHLQILPCATMLHTIDVLDLGGYGAFKAQLAVDGCVWKSICITKGGLVKINEKLVVYTLHQSESSASIELWAKDMHIVNQLAIELARQHLQPKYLPRLKELHDSASLRLPLSVIKRNVFYNKHYSLTRLIRDVWMYRNKVASSLFFYYIPHSIHKIFNNYEKRRVDV